MTTSESKGRFFFYKTNRFESIRITNRIEWIRIANWNALVPSGLIVKSQSLFIYLRICFAHNKRTLLLVSKLISHLARNCAPRSRHGVNFTQKWRELFTADRMMMAAASDSD